MADILLDNQNQSALSVGASQGGGFFDTNTGLWMTKDAVARCYGTVLNASIASQGAGFSTDTYVTDSHLIVPSCSLQVRTVLRFQISASKTAASTAQPVYTLRLGSNKSTADTAILAITGPAQTAIADIGTLNLMYVVRSIGAAGVIQGTAWWDHRGTAANTTTSGVGFANDTTGHTEATSAGFDTTGRGGQWFGVSLNGSTSASWTLTQVQAEANW